MTAKNNPKTYIFGPAMFAWKSTANLDAAGELYDPQLIELIKAGKRGLSYGIKIRKFRCSICREDYELCQHEEGRIYDGNECEPVVDDWEAIEISIVDKPKDPRAQIMDMLTVEKQGNHHAYTWYGFKVDKENRRFQHIQTALNNGWITESAAEYFSKLFSITLDGILKYPP